MKPVGADFGSLGLTSFMPRSMPMARSNRGCGWYALEREGCPKGRSPAPHAGIVLAQQLVGIKLFRTCQGRRFGNAGAEAIPRDHRRDRVKGVLLALARRSQAASTRGYSEPCH